MKPVMQTRFGQPHGNCMNACVCSILEIPLDAFDPDCAAESDAFAWQLFEDALRARGWALLEVRLESGETFWSRMRDVPVIAGGPGPRGGSHAVVYVNGELVHDPHPDGGGLTEVETYAVLVPIEPAAKEADKRLREALKEMRLRTVEERDKDTRVGALLLSLAGFLKLCRETETFGEHGSKESLKLEEKVGALLAPAEGESE